MRLVLLAAIALASVSATHAQPQPRPSGAYEKSVEDSMCPQKDLACLEALAKNRIAAAANACATKADVVAALREQLHLEPLMFPAKNTGCLTRGELADAVREVAAAKPDGLSPAEINAIRRQSNK